MNEWNKEIQNENELQVVISVSKAEELGKWLGILFWMVIPSIAGAVLSNQAVAAWLPFLYLPGRIISMVTLCAYGYILLKLSSESSRYRMAAILLSGIRCSGCRKLSGSGGRCYGFADRTAFLPCDDPGHFTGNIPSIWAIPK